MKETVKLTLSQGTRLEVESGGEWWEATVLHLKGDLVKIHYVGGISVFGSSLIQRHQYIALISKKHQGQRMKMSGFRHHRQDFEGHRSMAHHPPAPNQRSLT
jgi:hypothetical protein